MKNTIDLLFLILSTKIKNISNFIFKFFLVERKKTVKNYEIIILLNPHFYTQSKILIEKCTQIIEKKKGTIARIENWGLKNLTYRIKKHTKAIYILLNIVCTKETLDLIKNEIKFNDTIIRSLITKTKTLMNEPSSMANINHDKNFN